MDEFVIRKKLHIWNVNSTYIRQRNAHRVKVLKEYPTRNYLVGVFPVGF